MANEGNVKTEPQETDPQTDPFWSSVVLTGNPTSRPLPYAVGCFGAVSF